MTLRINSFVFFFVLIISQFWFSMKFLQIWIRRPSWNYHHLIKQIFLNWLEELSFSSNLVEDWRNKYQRETRSYREGGSLNSIRSFYVTLSWQPEIKQVVGLIQIASYTAEQERQQLLLAHGNRYRRYWSLNWSEENLGLKSATAETRTYIAIIIWLLNVGSCAFNSRQTNTT